MQYPIILADADDTLLDFHRAEDQAIRHTIERWGVPGTDENAARYAAVNKSWWERFERGECEREELLTARFREFFGLFGREVDADAVQSVYREQLSQGAFLLPEAEALCRTLKERGHRLYLVTNGITYVQHRRLAKSGLDRLVDGVFISEELGVQKPQPAFFDAVIAAIGEPDRSKYLLLGDSQTSDMAGGSRSGLATCWFNPKGAEAQGAWDYEIAALPEFLTIA